MNRRFVISFFSCHKLLSLSGFHTSYIGSARLIDFSVACTFWRFAFGRFKNSTLSLKQILVFEIRNVILASKCFRLLNRSHRFEEKFSRNILDEFLWKNVSNFFSAFLFFLFVLVKIFVFVKPERRKWKRFSLFCPYIMFDFCIICECLNCLWLTLHLSLPPCKLIRYLFKLPFTHIIYIFCLTKQ